MSNGIVQRQNEEKSIKRLAAQRQIYSNAKRNQAVVTLLLTILPFAFSFLKILFEKSTIWLGTTAIFITACLIVGTYIRSYVKKEKNDAASIQQQFDIYVYQMPWEERLFGEKKDVNDIIVKASKKIENKKEELKKLKDWYPEKVDLFPINEGILECQKVNVRWDLGLKKRYKIAVCSVIIIFCSIILATGIFRNETLWDFMTTIPIFVPLLLWLHSTVKGLNEDITRLTSLHNELISSSCDDMEKLQKIQKGIYENRRSSCFIPNWFYKLFWSNDEENAERTVAMNINH